METILGPAGPASPTTAERQTDDHRSQAGDIVGRVHPARTITTRTPISDSTRAGGSRSAEGGVRLLDHRQQSVEQPPGGPFELDDRPRLARDLIERWQVLPGCELTWVQALDQAGEVG